MNYRGLFVGMMALIIALVVFVPVTGQTGTTESQGWTVPRTPDGHPDLQGVWANNSATPLERPDILSDRAELTEEEVADLSLRARELFNGETDAAFGDSVFEAALADQQGYTSSDTGTGNYNQFWLVDREFENRTALVVDPPDGRVPALTAEGSTRTATVSSGRSSSRLDH